MKVECPFCKEKYDIKRSQLGRRATCTMCEQSFILYVEGVTPLPPRKKNPKLLLFILLGFVAVAAIGAGAYWFFMFYFPKIKANAEDTGSEAPSAIASTITQAEMLSSNNNLKQIFVGFQMHANDGSDGLMPDSLSVLLEKNILSDPKIFIASFDKVSTPASGKIMPENTTYVYLGAGLKTGTQAVIAFEKPWLFPAGWNKLNVLRADGSVTTETIDGLSEMTCRQVVELLTKDFQDKPLVNELLNSADKEDKARKQDSPEQQAQ